MSHAEAEKKQDRRAVRVPAAASSAGVEAYTTGEPHRYDLTLIRIALTQWRSDRDACGSERCHPRANRSSTSAGHDRYCAAHFLIILAGLAASPDGACLTAFSRTARSARSVECSPSSCFNLQYRSRHACACLLCLHSSRHFAKLPFSCYVFC